MILPHTTPQVGVGVVSTDALFALRSDEVIQTAPGSSMLPTAVNSQVDEGDALVSRTHPVRWFGPESCIS